MTIELKYEAFENLELYSKLLNKDMNAMIDEALSQYFENEEKKLQQKGIEDDSLLTNLDYDEFWEGVEI
jgi:hypothetical protein